MCYAWGETWSIYHDRKQKLMQVLTCLSNQEVEVFSTIEN